VAILLNVDTAEVCLTRRYKLIGESTAEFDVGLGADAREVRGANRGPSDQIGQQRRINEEQGA
jgi:hypothetical protein